MSLYISDFFFITSLAAGTCAWAKFCHHKTAETCPHRQQASLVDVSLTSTWTIDPYQHGVLDCVVALFDLMAIKVIATQCDYIALGW